MMKLQHKSGLALVSALALTISVLAACDPVDPNQTPQERSALLELDLLSKTDPVFIAIASKFPEDWSGIREDLARDYANSTSREEVIAAATQHLHEFIGSKAAATAAAPSSAIVEIIRAEREALKVLQATDEALCAQFAKGNLTRTADLSDKALSLMSIVGQKRVLATRLGTDAPQLRTAPTDEDLAILDRAMLESDAPADWASDTPRDDTQTCATALTAYNILSTLPEDQAARIFSQLGMHPAARAEQGK